MYVSEFTTFMSQFLDANPVVSEERLVRRAVWWDHPVDSAFEQAAAASKVAVLPYAYQAYVYKQK